MIRVGLLGCGGMGRTHNMALRQLSEDHDIRITAIADPDKDKRCKGAEIWGEIEQYETGMELIHNADVDAVYICLPSYLHMEHMIEAVKYGKHVFCEKPVCLTQDEIDTLTDLEKKTDRKIFIGHVVRFFPEFRFVRDCYKDQRYGKLISLDMKRTGGFPTWGFENWFYDDKRSGSVVLDLQIHDVDFLTYLFDEEPEIVNVQATRLDNGLINHIHTVFRHDDTLCTVTGHWDRSSIYRFQPEFQACFENATVEWKGKQVSVYTTDGREYEAEIEKVKTDHEIEGINVKDCGPYYLEDRYFAESLINDTAIDNCTLTDSLRSVSICLKQKALA